MRHSANPADSCLTRLSYALAPLPGVPFKYAEWKTAGCTQDEDSNTILAIWLSAAKSTTTPQRPR